MKKLAILVMAMVLVVGMSVGVMAVEEGTLEDEATVSDNTDVTINVDKYAEVDLEGTGYQIDLPRPGIPSDGEGHYEYSTDIPLTIQTNTNINLTVQEDVSRTIADAVGNEDFVWAFDDEAWGSTVDWSDTSFVISPSVEIWLNENGPGLPPSRWADGTECTTNLDYAAGEITRVVRLNVHFNEESADGSFDWTNLEADAYSGTVYATVAAQQ